MLQLPAWQFVIEEAVLGVLSEGAFAHNGQKSVPISDGLICQNAGLLFTHPNHARPALPSHPLMGAVILSNPVREFLSMFSRRRQGKHIVCAVLGVVPPLCSVYVVPNDVPSTLDSYQETHWVPSSKVSHSLAARNPPPCLHFESTMLTHPAAPLVPAHPQAASSLCCPQLYKHMLHRLIYDRKPFSQQHAANASHQSFLPVPHTHPDTGWQQPKPQRAAPCEGPHLAVCTVRSAPKISGRACYGR